MVALTTIVDQLEEDIAFGMIHPRERLVEEDLAARFDVKRHVIRQALSELQKMGLIQHTRNKGALVKDLNPAEVTQIYSIRGVLEEAAVKALTCHVAGASIEHLRSIQRGHEEGVSVHDFHKVFRANLEFHEYLFGLCGNTHLAEAIQNFAQKTHGIRSYSIMRLDYLQQACDEHWAMIDALDKGTRIVSSISADGISVLR